MFLVHLLYGCGHIAKSGDVGKKKKIKMKTKIKIKTKMKKNILLEIKRWKVDMENTKYDSLIANACT